MFVTHGAKYTSQAKSVSLQIAVEHGRQVVTGISLFRAALLTGYLSLSGIPFEAICRAVIKRPLAKLQLLLEGYTTTLFACCRACLQRPAWRGERNVCLLATAGANGTRSHIEGQVCRTHQGVSVRRGRKGPSLCRKSARKKKKIIKKK